ncbi:DnaJ-class molecular chaperone with C-terminal Zn finger domain [Desulfosporosinus orientis DSM 765]|uniref:DnaJ-class molecular chaperone with C-terminal Zn finger domain n=1 Tax=Desulfosporosinus orientis (strain ATCC 19365 / DSM 765 / NCIMB 8382 / VKM B-1628 / Singapore I) TaxID=768706 RepID=G7WJN3_DESOD|nr:cytochrome c3 family protein [Desulfosporosinus orientis]AET70470.1 DnaJ-class molecular chaperone with C-terminal Zn finger domain [Desulfosporosinus orientis DSM 765]
MYKEKTQPLTMLMNIFLLVLLSLAVSAAPAQGEESCLQCHGDKASNLQSSVHSFLSCTSCHTNIQGFPHPEGAALTKKEVVAACSSCHKGEIAESYAESYHGKAVKLGSTKAATCANCHGSHNILGPDDPKSLVSAANTPKTCAGCHDKASPGFSQGETHFKLASTGSGAPMYYTAKFFVWLTIITITLLIIHIEMQLYHNLRSVLGARKKGGDNLG